jgi:DNA polymerase
MIEKMPTAPAPHHAKVQAKPWPTPREPAPSDDGAGDDEDGLFEA